CVAFAVLAGEKARGERRERLLDDAEFSERGQHVLFEPTLHERIAILRDGEPAGKLRAGNDRGGTQALRGEQRGADLPNLSGLDELLERTEVVGLPHVWIVTMGEVQVDVIGAEAAQRIVDRGADVLRRKPGALRMRKHFRGDDEIIAFAPPPEPCTNDFLGLPSAVAG